MGYHWEGFGHEWAEINSSKGSAVCRLHHEPHTIPLGKAGALPGAAIRGSRVPQTQRQSADPAG